MNRLTAELLLIRTRFAYAWWAFKHPHLLSFIYSAAYFEPEDKRTGNDWQVCRYLGTLPEWKGRTP